MEEQMMFSKKEKEVVVEKKMQYNIYDIGYN
jgi:hypothetical protein